MIGRRDFLRTIAAGAAVAAPSIVPSSALGRDGSVAPGDRIVMGCIGVGRQGGGDMRGFLNEPDARVVAVCDVRQSARDRAADMVNNRNGDKQCVAYNDYRELLVRPDIDAVLIATGERWHPLVAIEAARHGKHMYCEKPLALSVAEAKAVRAAVRQSGVAFQCGTQQRSSFYYRHAVELVRNGRIGRLETIMVASVQGGSDNNTMYGQPKDSPAGIDYEMWLGPSPWAPYMDIVVSTTAWLFMSPYGLGCIDGAWGIHDVDIAQWLTGDASTPVEVDAAGAAKSFTDLRDTPYEWATEQKYANGVRLIHMDMRTAKKRASQFDLLPSIGATVVFGSEGWIYVSREGLITHPAKLASETIGPNEIQVIRSDNHRRNLLNAIRTGRKTISPIDVAARDQMVVQQQYIALCLGRKLRWDPAREEFIGDADANRMLSRPMRGPWHI
jgi:predicted dehydrogenase